MEKQFYISMINMKRKFGKTFAFGTKVIEQFASDVVTGWQYLFSDSSENHECLPEGKYYSFLPYLSEQSADKDSNCELSNHLNNLFLPKEELYFGHQLLYPDFFRKFKTSVSNKKLFDLNNVKKRNLEYPKEYIIKSSEDINSVVTVRNCSSTSNELQNTFCYSLDNNSSFTNMNNDNNSKISPVSDLNSVSLQNDRYNFKNNIHIGSDSNDIVLLKTGSVQKLTNNQISPGNISLDYKKVLFSSKNMEDNFYQDFKILLDSEEVHNSSLNMPIYFKENKGMFYHMYNRNSSGVEDNNILCEIITPLYNLTKHANEIFKHSYTITSQILHFLKTVFDFIKMMNIKINEVGLFTFENQIFFLFLRKKFNDFFTEILRYMSHQEQINVLFLFRSLLSKITFPKLDACAYHVSKKCLYFPKYSEINNSFNMNKHRSERLNPNFFDLDINIPNLQTNIAFHNTNKQRISYEFESLNIDNLSEVNNQLYLTYNHNSDIENAEISVVDNARQISTNFHLTEKSSTKILNTAFDTAKFDKNLLKKDFDKRVPKKRKKMSTANGMKRVRLDKHYEVKSYKNGNQYELNDNLDVEKAEISAVDNIRQICTNFHLTEKLRTKDLNTDFNHIKFEKNVFKTDFDKRVSKKKEKVSPHNDKKRVNSGKHGEVKCYKIENKSVLTDKRFLQPEKTGNFSQNPTSKDITDCKINICNDTNLEEKPEDTIDECLQTDSELEKDLTQKCFDCVVILKDFNCKEYEHNKKLSNNNPSNVDVLSAVSNEVNISPGNRCSKRKNSNHLTEKILNKKAKTGYEKEQKNATLDDQQFSGHRRSCRFLNKLKKCFSCCSTSPENKSEVVKKDSNHSKHGKDAIFSSKCSEACNSISDEISSLKAENVSFDSNYPTTEDFYSQLFNEKSSVKRSKKSINKTKNKANKHQPHQSETKKNLQKCKLKTETHALKGEKEVLIEKKRSDQKKKDAIEKKTTSNMALTTHNKTAPDFQSMTECNCRAKSVKKCRCLRKTREKIASTFSKNSNSRKQEISKTEKSNSFIISSTQSNAFYSTDDSSYFQFTKTIQGTYKIPPSRKKKTNSDFGKPENFADKRGRAKYSRNISETKKLDDSQDSLESIYSSPMNDFQGSNSTNNRFKRKRDSNEEKWGKISNSKAVVKFSNNHLLPYPKIVDDRMYYVESGEMKVATIDDLCLKPAKLNTRQKCRK